MAPFLETVGSVLAPYGVSAGRKWLRSDRAKNLNRHVRRSLASGGVIAGWTPSELEAHWDAILLDELAAGLMKRLLRRGSGADRDRLAERVGVLVRAVEPVGDADEATEYLVRLIESALVKSQPGIDDMLSYAADAVREDVADVKEMLAGVHSVVLPGDVSDTAARIISELREESSKAAGELAALVKDDSSGQQLVEALRKPTGSLSTVAAHRASARVLMTTGLWRAASQVFEKAARHDVATDPAADLMSAALCADLSGESDRAARLRAEGQRVYPSNAAVLLDAAGREESPADCLAALAAITPTSQKQRSRLESERAVALLKLGRFPEAADAAGFARDAYEYGPGRELQALVAIRWALTEPTRCVTARRDLAAAASSSDELVEHLIVSGRRDAAGLLLGRAALASALLSDAGKCEERIDRALNDAEIRLDADGRSHLLDAALKIGDFERAARLADRASDNVGLRLVSVALAVVRGDITEGELAWLECAASDANSLPAVAEYAAAVRLKACQDPAVPWPGDLMGRWPNGHVEVARVRALRSARKGDVPRARQLLRAFHDPESLRLRHGLAARDDAADALGVARTLVRVEPTLENRMLLSRTLGANGKYEEAAQEALIVGRTEYVGREIISDAYELALRAVSNLLDPSRIVNLAREWRAANGDRRAVLWLSRALAKRGDWDAAERELRDASFVPEDHDECLLVIGIAEKTRDPATYLRVAVELSDARGRPEALEAALMRAALVAGDDVVLESELEQRVRETFATFSTRFPESTTMRSIDIDPDDPLRTLQQLVPKPSASVVSLRRSTVDGVRRGTLPLETMVKLTGKSLVEVWVGWQALPLSRPSQAGHEALAAARVSGAAVWSADAVIVMAGLPEGLREAARQLLPASIVAPRSTALLHPPAFVPPVGGPVVSRQPDGSLLIEEGDPGYGLRVGQAVSVIPEFLEFLRPLEQTSDSEGETKWDHLVRETSFAASIELARATGLPVFVADRGARALAVDRGVAVFGVLELAHALRAEHDADIVPHFREHGAWGLPVEPGWLTRQVRQSGWGLDQSTRALFTDEMAFPELDGAIIAEASELLGSVADHAPDSLLELTTAVVRLLVIGSRRAYSEIARELLNASPSLRQERLGEALATIEFTDAW